MGREWEGHVQIVNETSLVDDYEFVSWTADQFNFPTKFYVPKVKSKQTNDFYNVFISFSYENVRGIFTILKFDIYVAASYRHVLLSTRFFKPLQVSRVFKTYLTLSWLVGWFVHSVTGPVFTNHSQEHSSSFSPRFCNFECNTTTDWLNRMV